MSTVLIVEDSEEDQFLYKHMISKTDSNIEIHQAFDGQEALELIEKENLDPDLILLDINMPRMNGFDFLEAFVNGDDREIPVIAMLTSSGHEQDKQRAFAYKCVKDYIMKPLEEQDVQKFESIIKSATA